jgi:Flp pilus assembly protein TadD
VPESVLNGNALVACSESADLLAALGAAFGEKGFAVNAVAALSLAVSLEPQDDAVRERLASAIAAAGK